MIRFGPITYKAYGENGDDIYLDGELRITRKRTMTLPLGMEASQTDLFNADLTQEDKVDVLNNQSQFTGIHPNDNGLIRL